MERLAVRVGTSLQRRNWTLVTAESCTGGWIAKCVTDVGGSSAWFERGFVTYSNLSKRELLGVRAETLERYGAVSEAVVMEMASGALTRSQAQVAVAVSGIAGPTGGAPDKPVGLVWLAWQVKGQPCRTERVRFAGDRESVRRQAVQRALEGILTVCSPGRRRLFFALWPDDKVLAGLQHLHQRLDLAQGRPVEPERFHITLLFLGEVPEDRIDALKAVADTLSLPPCELTFTRLEHWVRPAVLCLTADAVPEPLTALVETLQREVRRLGFRAEKRPFRPHLTLARKVKKRVVQREIEPVHWPVNGFALVESDLNAERPRYVILDRWPRQE